MSQYPIFDFFWHGPLSNWSHSPFTARLWDGLERDFVNTEQWMMACKARLFEDFKSFDKILQETDPKLIKALGRQVLNFNQTIWNDNSRNLVYVGLSHKFQQNSRAWEILYSTKGILVEASPYDQIWGIGLASNHPDAQNPARWKGTNWLGNVLMAVRGDISKNINLTPKRKLIFQSIVEKKPTPDLYTCCPLSLLPL